MSQKIDGDEGANKQADPEVKTEEVSQPDSQLDLKSNQFRIESNPEKKMVTIK